MAASKYNPFAKRSEFSRSNLQAYKALTILSWLLVVISGIYYTFKAPEDRRHHHNYRTIWGQNNHYATPFSLNAVVTSVYWIVLLLLQAQYVRYLYNADTSTAAANVGSHFIVNNLLVFGFIMLWVRGYFWPAELLLLLSMANQTMLYFRHSTTPRFMHIPIVSGPLAWTYVAILWNGAAMFHSHELLGRIMANLAIWGILVIGAFFILTFKDYTIGFELAILSLSLALAQMATHVIAFQWIFAFVIMGCLLFLSLLVGVPGILGSKSAEARQEGAVVSADRERQPLLNDA